MNESKLSRLKLYFEKVEHRSPKLEAKRKGHRVKDAPVPAGLIGEKR